MPETTTNTTSAKNRQMLGVERQRNMPYRILAYLLYSGPKDWLEILGGGKVRIHTGPAARFLKIKNVDLWERLHWLADNGLLVSVRKERMRGSAIIMLRDVPNLQPLSSTATEEVPDAR